MNQYERLSLGLFQDFAYSDFTPGQLKTLKNYGYFEKDFLKNDKEMNDKEMTTKITENLFIFSAMPSFTLPVDRSISYNNHESKDSFKHSSIHLSKMLFSAPTYQSFYHRLFTTLLYSCLVPLSISHSILPMDPQIFYSMHDSTQPHTVKISSIYLPKLPPSYLLDYGIT